MYIQTTRWFVKVCHTPETSSIWSTALSEDDENTRDSYDSSENDVADEEEEDDEDFVTVSDASMSRDSRLL